MVNVSVRFPNESEYVEMAFDMSKFIPEEKYRGYFDKEVFGYYNGTYIAVKKEDYEKHI